MNPEYECMNRTIDLSHVREVGKVKRCFFNKKKSKFKLTMNQANQKFVGKNVDIILARNDILNMRKQYVKELHERYVPFIPKENTVVLIADTTENTLKIFFVKTVRFVDKDMLIGGWFLTIKTDCPFDTSLVVFKIPGPNNYFLKPPNDQLIRFFKNKLASFKTPTSSPKTINYIDEFIKSIS